MSNTTVHSFARARRRAVALIAALTLATACCALVAATGAVASSSSHTSLSEGSTGSAVRDVQRKLHVEVTGYFGSETVRAVRRFQSHHDLKVTGVVNDATARALGVRLRKSSFASGGASAPPSSSSKHKSTKLKLPAELRKIAQCESGGNPRAISPGGHYRGKYQFDMETWHSIGGKGDPAKASEDEQDRRALKLYHQRGKSPWPNCA